MDTISMRTGSRRRCRCRLSSWRQQAAVVEAASASGGDQQSILRVRVMSWIKTWTPSRVRTQPTYIYDVSWYPAEVVHKLRDPDLDQAPMDRLINGIFIASSAMVRDPGGHPSPRH
jgi:hypothetical protein